MNPLFQSPILMKDHKSLCCLCCKSGPISVTMSLDRSGFVPGEKLTLNAEVDNKSNKTMTRSEVKLLQTTIFRARDGHTQVGLANSSAVRGFQSSIKFYRKS